MIEMMIDLPHTFLENSLFKESISFFSVDVKTFELLHLGQFVKSPKKIYSHSLHLTTEE